MRERAFGSLKYEHLYRMEIQTLANLAREAETRELLGRLDQLDPEQSAWLQEVTGQERQAAHQCWPETVTASYSGGQ